MINNLKYLLDVDDNQIAVNDHAILDHDHPVRSQLTFQLLNPDRVNQIVFSNPEKVTSETILKKLQNGEQVTGVSYVRIYFPIGNAEGDFIDEERGRLMTFETESGDWSVADGMIEEDQISFVISCYNQTILQNMFSVFFRCRNIQSYAPIGMTYVYAEIKNVAGIHNVVKVYPIRKKPAVPQINRLVSNRTTIGTSGTVRLNWQISGAKEGLLSPGEINILQLPAPGVDVVLNRSMEYRLSLKGNGLDADASLNLYVHPPEILQLDFDPAVSQVTWRTQYSDELELTVGKTKTSVEKEGTRNIQMPDKPQIVLRGHGLLFTQYGALNLQGLTLDKPQLFRSWIRVYSSYIYTRWEWKTIDCTKVVFMFTEDGSLWHEASILTSGEFEYVSSSPLLGAKLVCTKKDGTTYPLLWLDGEGV